MRINSKVLWGLAWTGLAVVVAVPSADFLTGKIGPTGKAAVITSDTDPVKTASVTTTVTERGVTITPAGTTPSADPVDKLLKTGKKLPSYITEENSATTPTAPASAAPTAVASIDPVVAPTPFPSWARPTSLSVPSAPATTGTVDAPAAVASEPTVIVEETTPPTTQEASIQTAPVPPAPIVDDSANWDSETLRQYLERRGLLEGSDSPRSSASVTVVERPSGNYDANGFFLSDGPNNDSARARRLARLRRLYGEDYVDNGMADFNLF